jgi:hypothetical protein
MIGLQSFDFPHEFGCFFEAAINAGEANVGHFVDLAQSLHDPLADGHAGNFSFILVADFVGDVFHQFLNDFGTDGTFLTGLLDARKELFFGKLLSAPVSFDDHKPFVLNHFVSGIAMTALQTLTASPNGRSFAGGTRIDDLIVLIAALWTTHTGFVNRYIM